MFAITANSDASETIRRINKTLKGPVSVILSGAVVDLSGIPKAQIYDHILGNLAILSKSLKVLRTDRRRFLDVLVDAKGKKVEDDTSPLACGRSINQVVGMVIRTATKRYFRAVSEGPSTYPHLTSQDQADRLYEAIRDYLMHDWQVPLVPTYAEMTPDIARRIGGDLALIQDPQQLRDRIAKSGISVDTPSPVPTTTAQESVDYDPFSIYLSLDGGRVNLESFDEILARGDVKKELGSTDIKTALKTVGGPSARFLVYGMGLNPDQFVVILSAAFEVMGAEVFSRIMGLPGDRELVVKLAQYGMAKNINGQTPLSDCSFFIKNFVSQAVTGKSSKSGP